MKEIQKLDSNNLICGHRLLPIGQYVFGALILGATLYFLANMPTGFLSRGGRFNFAAISLANDMEKNYDTYLKILQLDNELDALTQVESDKNLNARSLAILSAEFGRYDVTKRILLQNQGDYHLYKLCLEKSAQFGHLDIVVFIINKTRFNYDNLEASFEKALENGHAEVVALLLDRGANPWASGAGDALHKALAAGHVPAATLVMEARWGVVIWWLCFAGVLIFIYGVIAVYLNKREARRVQSDLEAIQRAQKKNRR
jgi:hypothetical protein